MVYSLESLNTLHQTNMCIKSAVGQKPFNGDGHIGKSESLGNLIEIAKKLAKILQIICNSPNLPKRFTTKIFYYTVHACGYLL